MCLAIPAKLVRIHSSTGANPDDHALDELNLTGVIEMEGLEQTVNLSLTPSAQVGQFLLIHVGFAIAIMDSTAAERTLTELAALELPPVALPAALKEP